MVHVGIVGLGPAWESRYQPALRKLNHRITVRAVYDSVHHRAMQAAAECGAAPVLGVRALIERSDLRAILVLDAGWAPLATLGMLCRARRPLFVASGLPDDPTTIDGFRAAAAQHDLTLMPALWRRYTPATSRLHELIATRLGRVRRLAVDAARSEVDVGGNGPCGRDLAELVDWCRYVTGRPVSTLRDVSPAADDGVRSLEVEFEPPKSGGPPTVAKLQFSVRPEKHEGGPERGGSETTVCEVQCEAGEAVLRSPVEIGWNCNGTVNEEALLSDRPDAEVMLDHFCRRVAGGLIPIADLNDYCRGVAISRAARECLRTRGEVRLGDG